MKNQLLRRLPSVDELLKDADLKKAASLHSTALVTEALRAVLDTVRREIMFEDRKEAERDTIIGLVLGEIDRLTSPSIVKVINASGTILHTNIGRAVLCKEAQEAVRAAAEGNLNIEFDLAEGARGDRDAHVEGLIRRLTGAEGACVVNNNAAAVLITLNTLAEAREVVISRGELIEIGGSFRLPDVIGKSGCVLKEVGTTNRTHAKDFTNAIGSNTALLLKAHTSNYRVVGFTSEVSLNEISDIGKKHSIPVVEDLGSGSLIDLSIFGLPKEPVVSESIASGADIVTFSGDKLLGGPQAGVIVGRKELIDRIKRNPLKRALRVDKLTLAALEATLRLYLNLETLPKRLPTLYFLTRPLDVIEDIAVKAGSLIKYVLGDAFKIEVEDSESIVGGGCLPEVRLPTKAVTITHPEKGPDKIFRLFLHNRAPILGRINNDRFLLDMRTIEDPASVVPSIQEAS